MIFFLVIIIIVFVVVFFIHLKHVERDYSYKQSLFTIRALRGIICDLEHLTKFDWSGLLLIHKKADRYNIKNEFTIPNTIFRCSSIQNMTFRDIYFNEKESLADLFTIGNSVKLHVVWYIYYNLLYNNYKEILNKKDGNV